ncbi:MAG: DUF3276 family protein [Proteobacteria bacterium]|nr:DUF3276 family protein [Pseudomonadota bacterium]
MATNTSIYSTMIRSGRTTYFVDVREAKNGSKFISISENKIDGEERKRVTVRVFSESIVEFRKAIDEAAATLKV